jgi:hypothetical protein
VGSGQGIGGGHGSLFSSLRTLRIKRMATIASTTTTPTQSECSLPAIPLGYRYGWVVFLATKIGRIGLKNCRTAGCEEGF